MLGLTGLYGVVYALRVMYRARRLSAYRPQLDDWLWHAILPFVGYVVIVAAALRLSAVPTGALFALAGATVLLIFIGIHNAWDVVTYLAIEQIQRSIGGGVPGVEHRSEATTGASAVTPRSGGHGEPPSVR
jgi:hypothetical protein